MEKNGKNDKWMGKEWFTHSITRSVDLVSSSGIKTGHFGKQSHHLANLICYIPTTGLIDDKTYRIRFLIMVAYLTPFLTVSGNKQVRCCKPWLDEGRTPFCRRWYCREDSRLCHQVRYKHNLPGYSITWIRIRIHKLTPRLIWGF